MIFCSCNYVVVNVVEAYLLNTLMKMAEYDKDKVGKDRGVNYFIDNGHKESEDELIKSYGFNAITLAIELIRGAAIIKPKKTYFNDET